ncbi:protease pro-enzyme activation domain-containing protein [Streptomyces sp. NPDC127038]|uniref:S53 family peptidase n=1 Tax=Streptomyces sp. NPDC127038 TaxID=3347114 RepID=UPI00365A7AD3
MSFLARIRPGRRLRPYVAAAACSALLGTAPLATAHSADLRHPLAGSRPAYATAAADAGPVPGDQHVSARLYLNSRDPQGLTDLLRDISDPHSPHYRHYLTPQEYQRRFGPTAAQLADVSAWLHASGLTVTRRTTHYVKITGTAGAVRRAFGASLHRYRTGRGTSQAPAGDLSVPASLATTLLGVSGLSTPGAARPLSAPTPTPAPALGVAADGAVCSGHFGQKPATGFPQAHGKIPAYAPCAYLPAQLRHAYGAGTTRGATGRGSTIAIVDAYGSPDMPADADRYAKIAGDHAFRPHQYRQHVTPADWHVSDACAPPGTWAGEQALDIDLAHGLAPDADILYVGADSCLDNDLMDAESYVIDGRRADGISNSWAEIVHSEPGHLTPALIDAWDLLFEQAAAEGIGVYFAAGDCGDSSPDAARTGVNCDPKTTRAQADFPSGSPWVTSVGGTTLALDRHGDYAWETSMGDELSILTDNGTAWGPVPGVFTFGGGGGASDFPQPWYQHDRVPGRTGHRTTPDVSLEGDGALPVLIGLTDAGTFHLIGFGGTSAAAPAFAAIQADAQQACGHRLGFANPLLYALPRAHLFHDITDQPAEAGTPPLTVVRDEGPDTDTSTGEQRYLLYTLGHDFGLHARPGYDDATGLGSPTPAYLRWFQHTKGTLK